LDSARLCARLPGDVGEHRYRLQDDGLLRAGAGALSALERSGRRRRMADRRRADPFGKGQSRPAVGPGRRFSMRLLLTGSSGQIGWELRRRLAPAAELIAPDRSQLDFSEPRRIADIVRGIGPDVIVNAAAYTAVDKAEDEEALAMTINGTAVGVLAEEARRSGALLLHYSTDYVFDGSKHTPYIEDDPPHPINSYGRSKLAGETAIRQIGGASLILRTSWVYAARRDNFLRTMLRLAGEKDELRIVADQSGAPTWAHDIADATGRILSQAVAERTAGAFAPGVFHLTGSGSTTWHGFARVILDEASQLSLLQ